MITSIEILGLRGIKEGKIEGLAPLSIFLGPNGCGKTTVLEAMGVACAGASATAAFLALAHRDWLGPSGVVFWFEQDAKVHVRPHFTDDDRRSTVRLLLRIESGDSPGLVLKVERTWLSPLPVVPPERQVGSVVIDNQGGVVTADEGARRLPFSLNIGPVSRPPRALRASPAFSALREALAVIKLSPWYDDLITYLRELRPNLESIESLTVPGSDRDEPFMFEREPRMGYPLAFAGDGFRRAMTLAATFAQAKGGVAALDEPEAFAHPRMLSPIAKLIRRAIGDGTQVAVATHSLEFVSATLAAFATEPKKVAVIGLRRDGTRLDPVVVSGPDAIRRVVELGDDLRL